ncbi:MAG: outer membrane lipoprotein-sorting protein [Pseudomonadales bacterium]|nr:outer membrane lipoprotein-sorting protein [Pseudomonadales bacterium]MBO6702538.1 outer membrane lipoprotein-sorting protein [Pseudomonadales bacterium]MBO7006389.1 outer membrane lipoprotein-sorting protein [Pseudomonadales bacterium]
MARKNIARKNVAQKNVAQKNTAKKHMAKKLLLGWLILLPSALVAETPEEKGLAIAVEADRRDQGWVDMQVTMSMILRNARGDENHREMRLKSLEVPADGDKSIMVFDTPRDVQGTGLLTFSHKVEDDDQWLYLPALKRVKRIASKNKSGPFVGSEFAFEDLSSQEVEKYTYKYLRDETVNGLDCYVMARYPTDKYSGYTRQVTWIDKAHYRMQKVDYYDRKNKLLKTLTFSDYQQYLDKFWRADAMNMVNHVNNKSTELLWKEYSFQTGLVDRDFNKNALQRTR